MLNTYTAEPRNEVNFLWAGASHLVRLHLISYFFTSLVAFLTQGSALFCFEVMIIIINIKTALVHRKLINLSVLLESISTLIHCGLFPSLGVWGWTDCHAQTLATLPFQTLSNK